MILDSLFGNSKSSLVRRLKSSGSLIGERQLEGRTIYIYLLKNRFVQVMFKEDNPSSEVENILTFDSILKLNSHLEREFRQAF